MHRTSDDESHHAFADWQSGDPLLFSRLVQRFQGPMFGFLGRMGFSQADAEELAQETFLRAWRARETFDPARAQVSTWLFTIARNLALTEVVRRERLPDQTEPLDSIADADPARDPVAQLETQRQFDELRRALLQLSLDDRSAIALHYVQALSAHEAAAVVGCAEGTFRTRLSRAKGRLIEKMSVREIK